MSNSKFTLFGCERYFQNIGQSVFDNLTLPTTLTKGTLTDNILLRGGEFEVMYGDPDFLRAAIGAWSNKWMPTMQRWVDALAIDYNPLENYDRMEDWTDKTQRSDASTSDRTHGRSENVSHADNETVDESHSDEGSGSNATTTNEGVGKITDKDAFNGHPLTHTVERSAYDSSSYEPLTKETDAGKMEETIDTSRSESSATASKYSETNNTTKSGSFAEAKTENEDETANSSSAMNNDFEHTGRIHGNIGVTTSQQMLQAELDLGYWNIYEKITELFLQEFTIPIYL